MTPEQKENETSQVVPDEKVVSEVIQGAEKELDGLRTMPFTPAAFKLLKANIARYITDMVMESIRISKRDHTDDVSGTHVEDASRNLSPHSPKKFSRHMGVISGLFLGFAFSKMLMIINQGSASKMDYILIAVFGIAGALLLGFHMGKN